jgi:Copper transport outer membrane protein, MctB
LLDLRYHVASLAAVFLALVVGILVGVGISGRGFVDKSERRNFENRIAALQSRVDQLAAQKQLLTQQGTAEHTFVQETYPVLMRNRLAGKRLALVVLGTAGPVVGDVRQAIQDAGGTLALYRVLKQPVPVQAVRSVLRGRSGFQTMAAVGHELAQEWVTQGVTPISDAVSPVLVEEQRGEPGQAIDGVVVVGPLPTDAPTSRFDVDGLLNGFAAVGVPTLAAERTDTQPTQVDAYGQIASLSVVDDADTPVGKLALALVLAGAPPGAYGISPRAESPLPRIAPAG